MTLKKHFFLKRRYISHNCCQVETEKQNVTPAILAPVHISNLTYKWYWQASFKLHEGVSKSFRTGRLERELQMVQLSDTTLQLYRYFVSQSSQFYRHNPLCCFSMSVYFCCYLFLYRLSSETFGYTLVFQLAGVDDTNSVRI
jgi:hypothetical protein